MARYRPVFVFCCCLTLLAGSVLPAAAQRETTWINTFAREFINWATTHEENFQFPPADLYEQINCHIEISCPVSPGDCDPWDRFGNLRLRHFENDSTYVDYEIARFITPYDITYSSGPGSCSWVVEVTDYQFLLHDEVTLRLYIESWMGDDRGWLMTITFEMVPGTPEREPFAIQRLWQSGFLVYGDPDNPPEDHLSPISVAIPEQATWVKFRAFSTGHGFLNTDNAAEFSYKWQGLSVDENYTEHFLWRSDCEYNRCSPQLGTWEYDRAGWCPGDKAEAWDVDVTDWVTPGVASLFTFFLQPYENWCRPNNPECVDTPSCECPGHAYYKYEGQVVYYRVPTTTAVGEGGAVQAKLHLVGNYPNPFNPLTTIQYHLAEPGEVTISVYNAEGALVRTLHQVHGESSTFAWTWNGRDRAGNLMPAGVYLYEVRYGQEQVSAKMLMLK